MQRTLALVGAGATLGAVLIYVAGSDESGSSFPVAAPDSSGALRVPGGSVPAPQPIDLLTLAAGSVGDAERAALSRLVAGADRRTLEALAAQVATLPPIEGRRIALEVLFARYAEIDAAAAASFARTLGLPPAALRPLYETWARHDARAALQAIGELAAPAASTLGVAVLDAIGNDRLGIARVLGAAPQIDAGRFRVEAAIAKAADDPSAALADLLELPPAHAHGAFDRLAAIWLDHDVHGAIAAAEAIADETLRDELKAALTRTWARVDPDALVDYVLGLDTQRATETLRLGALQAFAFSDPQRTLQAAERVGGEFGPMLRRAALLTVAREDPREALRIAESLPSAAERDRMLSVIATSFGRADPEAALAWAQALSPAAPNIVANVLAGFAHVDPERAIELLFQTVDATGQRGSGPFTVLLASGALNAEHIATVAARLLGTPGRSQELQQLTRLWAQRQPQDAVHWLLANERAAPRSVLAQAAVQLARENPAMAIDYLDEVPRELRATWLGSVAEGYSHNDARAAASWIAQHRGEAGYDEAVAAIAAATADTDPTEAARLLDSVDAAEAPYAPQAAQRIAASWARQDPGAAAAWAAALPGEHARATAVGEVAAQWAARDVTAARRWALGMPAGPARDRALVHLVGSAAADTVDHVVLDAFSSADAQQRGVAEVVRMLAARDPTGARQLADHYLTDPGARRAAELFIE